MPDTLKAESEQNMILSGGSGPGPGPKWDRAPQYAGYILTFLCGCLVTLAIRYFIRGTNVQLSPESFVSLVFTIAVGAASLVLAIVAINYGRISERVMTERSDRSIDIQMNLFQKSLDLQTQLFDKTMSTLESIGRSTGVTEQRLGDMHSLIQSPTFLKQIAGRAIEQTTTELNTSGKVGGQESQIEAHLAEKLTKNIVEELSARWELLTRPGQGGAGSIATGNPSLSSPTQAATTASPLKSFEEQAQQFQRKREITREKNHMQSVLEKAVASIPGAEIKRNEGALGRLWEDEIKYKGRRLAVDVRIGAGSATGFTSYDGSIQHLFTSEETDSLAFLFGRPPVQEVKEHLESRSRAIDGRVKILAATNEQQLQNDLLAALESMVAELPSSS